MYAKIYNEAAKILDKLINSKQSHSSSINNLVMSSPVQEKRKLTAVICHVLEYKEILEKVIQSSDIMKYEKKMSKTMILVLLHDFLIGDGIKCGGQLKLSIMKHRVRLKAEFVKLKVKLKAREKSQLKSETTKSFLELSSRIPRHIRVNTLKISVQNAINHFISCGYTFIQPPILSQLQQLEKNQFYQDPDIKELLVFPRGTDFHLDKLYKSGAIIIQEKSSCFPALALSPPPGSQVIDACAAPGNKTTHLAMIMQPTSSPSASSGKIYAFDKDEKRLGRLRKTVSLAACSNMVQVIGRDFLSVDLVSEYPDVEYVLLDPSCSGSGIVSRMDSLLTYEQPDQQQLQNGLNGTDDRLKQLSDFQVQIIQHAMTLPKLKRLVYSTCSVHEEENENVVVRVMQSEQGKKYRVVKCLDFWKHRGNDVAGSRDLADKLVRCSPESDCTNGFFVACFERK